MVDELCSFQVLDEAPIGGIAIGVSSESVEDRDMPPVRLDAVGRFQTKLGSYLESRPSDLEARGDMLTREAALHDAERGHWDEVIPTKLMREEPSRNLPAHLTGCRGFVCRVGTLSELCNGAESSVKHLELLVLMPATDRERRHMEDSRGPQVVLQVRLVHFGTLSPAPGALGKLIHHPGCTPLYSVK